MAPSARVKIKTHNQVIYTILAPVRWSLNLMGLWFPHLKSRKEDLCHEEPRGATDGAYIQTATNRGDNGMKDGLKGTFRPSNHKSWDLSQQSFSKIQSH